MWYVSIQQLGDSEEGTTLPFLLSFKLSTCKYVSVLTAVIVQLYPHVKTTQASLNNYFL